MKRFNKFLRIIVPSFVGFLFFTACGSNDPECATCDACCEKTPTYTVIVGKDSVPLTFYNAFTPRYYTQCDSLVQKDTTDLVYDDWIPPYGIDESYEYLRCTEAEAKEYIAQGIYDQCPCRFHPKEDENDDFNSEFVIGGIENFPCNKISFRVPGDTAKLDYIEKYPLGGVFVGTVVRDSTPIGRSPIEKMLESGVYEYEIIIYEGAESTCKNVGGHIEFKKDLIIDTITGTFCLIRPGAQNKSCQGAQANDPLLQ